MYYTVKTSSITMMNDLIAMSSGMLWNTTAVHDNITYLTPGGEACFDT